MLRFIHVDLRAVESMIFFWQLLSEREKVSEIYILSVAEMDQFRGIYDDEFDNISVRKVMSALSNREVFRGDNKAENRFWVDNLWMLEDLSRNMQMVQPIKSLQVGSLMEKINATIDSQYEALNVVIVPFHKRGSLMRNDTLYINFFALLFEKKIDGRFFGDHQSIQDYLFVHLVELILQSHEKGSQPEAVRPLRNVFY